MDERKVLSIEVFEVADPDTGRDYRVVVQGSHGGLKMEYETTVNDVREFFTEFNDRKEAQEIEEIEDEKEPAKLISLPDPEGVEES